VNIKRVSGGALRPGMWVEVKHPEQGERVGILTDMNAFGICAVMLVDPVEGTNVALMQVPSSEVRQARQMAIPKARLASRTTPTRTHGVCVMALVVPNTGEVIALNYSPARSARRRR
jgi:hypothetical protein